MSELHALSQDVHDSLKSKLESRWQHTADLKDKQDLDAYRTKLYQKLTDILRAHSIQNFVLQDATKTLQALYPVSGQGESRNSTIGAQTELVGHNSVSFP